MSIAKKIANENHEEVTRMTTRSSSKHGLSKVLSRGKRIRNRAAKRKEEKIAFEDEDVVGLMGPLFF